ncbi:MAG: 23S rRNA (uracil(1939)-C(5))-methyltransferase RlmD [Firmicutes bacterium]|nr:23S rRNA (uracil(1939)-C(5))-methyltransferase RlmD [Bacillota bacterium]
MKTEIKRWGINGEGVAYIDKKATFVPGAIIDETVEINIVEEKETYNIAKLVEVIEPSKYRRHPFCPIWKQCGGCSLMSVNYKGQCKMKESILKDSLSKYAHYEGRILPIVKNPEPLAYRNSCKLPFGRIDGRIVTGMYERNTTNFVALDRCYTHSKTIEKVRKEIEDIVNQFDLFLYNKEKGDGLKTLVLKEYNQKVQVVFITGEDTLPEEMIQKVADIEEVCSLWQSVRSKYEESHELFGDKMIHLALEEKVEVQLNNYSASLLPRSFFQLNTKQAIQMYEEVARLTPQSHVIVEAYSGIGAISLFVHDKAEKVIGIESILDAVENAEDNAQRNGIENVDFIHGDAAKELSYVKRVEKVDCLIVDPPRTGLDEEMKNAILDSEIETMIYVSCNPSTLAKDLDVLQQKYRILSVQPFDMFSQTGLVETVVLLKKMDPSKQRKPRRDSRSFEKRDDRRAPRKDGESKFDKDRKNFDRKDKKFDGERKRFDRKDKKFDGEKKRFEHKRFKKD